MREARPAQRKMAFFHAPLSEAINDNEAFYQGARQAPV